MSEIIYKQDEKGNLIYGKTSEAEFWIMYYEKYKLIHCNIFIDEIGELWVIKENGENDKFITEQDYKEIKFRIEEKEYFSRTKCSKFELVDIQKIIDKEIKKFDNRGNEIYIKTIDEDGYDECWFEYDENNNIVYFKNSYGDEEWSIYNKNNSLVNIVYSDGEQIWYEYGKNNTIHTKSSNGKECWCKCNKNGEQIEITKKEYKNFNIGE